MAPVLKDGIYQIRFVPRFILPPFFGGSYATGEEINAPIRAEALGPNVHGNQTWEVKSIAGKEHTVYTITRPKGIHPHEGVGPVLPGFGLRTKGPLAHKGLVMLTVDIKQFLIQLTPDATDQHLMANIIAPSPLIGATQAITEENHILYLEGFPVIEHMPPLPRWEFIPVKH